ncbi:MAG TPA: hypothetical protein VES65_04845 [Solirubrobacteraceae bacterium]|nr:hypothetical protein [Solirubrobacteraceae bacterium]
MDRYVIDTHPRIEQLVADGLDWLVREAISKGMTEAAVLVPEVQSIPNLPGDAGSALAKQNRQFFWDGRDIQILVARKLPYAFRGPVLVVWANSDMAAQAEHMDPPAICATGWERDGLADWVRVWGATDPRTGKHFPAEAADPAVVGAIASIAFHMTGDVLHPSDKTRAVDALRALMLCGYKIDPPMIRALAIQRGWLPRAADRLSDIARKFALGKAVQGGTKMTKTRAREMVERFEEADS